MEHDTGTSDLARVVIKTYSRQGEIQLVRLAVASEFHCSRCDKPKKAKLVAVVSGDWNRLLCNGCYGELLSGERCRSITPQGVLETHLGRIT